MTSISSEKKYYIIATVALFVVVFLVSFLIQRISADTSSAVPSQTNSVPADFSGLKVPTK